MKYISFFALIVLFFTACIPEPLKVDLPEEKPLIVVSSQILPNRTLVVFLTNSFSSLQSGTDTSQNIKTNLLETLLIDKALVTLTYNGKTEKLYRIEKGIYGTFDAVQIENQSYTLFVKGSLTGREATATTTFIMPAQIDSATAKIEIDDAFGAKDTVLKTKIQISDDPKQKNYYMVNYISLAGSKGLDFTKLLFGNSNKADLFTDDVADTNHKIVRKNNFSLNPKDTLVATVFSVTKEYYEYQNSYQKNGGFFSQLIGEPITIPTNVKNGQGFFNMALPSIRLLYGK